MASKNLIEDTLYMMNYFFFYILPSIDSLTIMSLFMDLFEAVLTGVC